MELRQCLFLGIGISSGCANFRARDLFERRETSSCGKAGLDRLREELTEFGGPEYEARYGQWRERGGAVRRAQRHETNMELSRTIPANIMIR